MEGSIRPIAIGMAFRRLASKCSAADSLQRLSAWFAPRQLDTGVSAGCEAAVHAARRFIDGTPADYVVAKLDLSNAFNSFHRRDMLSAVSDRLPQAYAYRYSAYSHLSFLFYGPFTILSQDNKATIWVCCCSATLFNP